VLKLKDFSSIHTGLIVDAWLLDAAFLALRNSLVYWPVFQPTTSQSGKCVSKRCTLCCAIASEYLESVSSLPGTT
jgi:hypothetical protein